jgi:hypothetical protein
MVVVMPIMVGVVAVMPTMVVMVPTILLDLTCFDPIIVHDRMSYEFRLCLVMG